MNGSFGINGNNEGNGIIGSYEIYRKKRFYRKKRGNGNLIIDYFPFFPKFQFFSAVRKLLSSGRLGGGACLKFGGEHKISPVRWGTGLVFVVKVDRERLSLETCIMRGSRFVRINILLGIHGGVAAGAGG